MKLSQPKSARVINTSRILALLKEDSSLSKAELSRKLDLNKVSCGEIVDDLIEKGIVREGQRLETTNGRPATSLELVTDRYWVVALNIGPKAIVTTISALDGKIAKFERIPTDFPVRAEEFCANLLKSILRTMKLVDKEKFLGVAVTSEIDIPYKNFDLQEVIKQTLGLESILEDTTVALVKAEKIIDKEPVMYINWGDTISLALVCDGRLATVSRDFANLTVTTDGTLSDFCIPKNDVRIKDSWASMPSETLEMIAKGIRVASRITGSKKVIIGGEGATIPDKCLEQIRNHCTGFEINRSKLGEWALSLCSAEVALDFFFYKTSMLNEVADYI